VDTERVKQPSSLRVLLVEDEMLVAMLVETMLIDLGHRITGPVGWLDQALTLAEREELDFAILDLNINGGKAYPVAAALAVRGIPFIFSTGYGRGGLAAPFESCPTLQKPYLIEDLRDAIEALFAVETSSRRKIAS
jgi:CheY-like chemotaxis protein